MRLRVGVSRQGVASVLGTVVFIFVFMLALGSIAYVTGLQAQSSKAQVQAESLAAAKGTERLDFRGSGPGLAVENVGGAGVYVNHVVMKFPNGTVLAVPTSSMVPAGGSLGLASIVPQGACPPGNSTCRSRLESILAGEPQGAAVGLLTSLGNTFWFYPGDLPAGSSTSYYRTPSVESTTATSYVAVPGLSFEGAAGASYTVQLSVGFWQSGPTSNPDMFAISVPAGATFMFCGGLDIATPGTGDVAPLNICSHSSGQSLGTTELGGGTCRVQAGACEFVGTAVVTFAGPGAFQLEFMGMSTGAANVFADSMLVVTEQG